MTYVELVLVVDDLRSSVVDGHRALRKSVLFFK